MKERVRFTVSVDSDVHAAFGEMAEASGQSLSRVVGDWLKDTTEAARFVSGRLRGMRGAPADVLFELGELQERAALETRHTASAIASGRLKVVEADARGWRTASTKRKPPCSPTGVKESTKGGKRS